MTNPTDPAAVDAWRAAYAAVYGCEITHPAHMYGNAYPIIQAYGDQREKAAVAEIVAWLRKHHEGLLSNNYHVMAAAGAFADAIEALAHKEASDGTAKEGYAAMLAAFRTEALGEG